MYVSRLVLHDFRSYPAVDLALEAGVTSFLGRNGQGKTNLVEAVDYLSRLSSHRVATDAPLVRAGAERAVVRAAVVRDGRTATLEVEVNPGRANRARVNQAWLPRTREIAGLVRTVVFSPEDLALVKGDPSERRRFLDDLLVVRTPRLAGVRADYDRVLKQRSSLLKSVRATRGSTPPGSVPDTLAVWDDHLARVGAEIVWERLRLVDQLGPHVVQAYADLAAGAKHTWVGLEYRASVPLAGPAEPAEPAERPEQSHLAARILAELERRRGEELDRGLTLVGPHRDDLQLWLGPAGGTWLPVKGYASHGEVWTFALALRLASYHLLQADGDDPILILDDVFAELDDGRRTRLAALVAGAEQLLVTAAVEADVPAELAGARFVVGDGEVRRAG